jgi:hypothetical protein
MLFCAEFANIYGKVFLKIFVFQQDDIDTAFTHLLAKYTWVRAIGIEKSPKTPGRKTF